MKYYLFIDNFRGFSNTYIPITDVNFLVGENSTGKTSVLGLIKLFAGQQSLLRHGFRDDDVNFGHFDDMVSAHSQDRSYFRIGLVWEQPRQQSHQEHKREEDGRATALLITFGSEQGLPRYHGLTFCRGTEVASFQFHKDGVFFKRTPYKQPLTVKQIVETELTNWIHEHVGGTGYIKIPTPKSI